MSVKEKVGQTIITYFRGKEVDSEVERLIQDFKIGGIILYTWANELNSATPEEVRSLTEGLQIMAIDNFIPKLFISIDEEGGAIRRLLGEGFTEFPGNAALGRTENPKYAYKAAHAVGGELKDVGINLNFAPVVDVHSNRNNWVIGIRSFGSNPEDVSVFGQRALEGYLDAGIIPCLKHFPGHGDVSSDPHFTLPVEANKTLDDLLTVELLPFKKLAPLTPAIMTAHIHFPLIDQYNCATLSSFFLGNILRDKFQFNGVVITDSLTMQGVLNNNNIEDIAVSAVLAGNDILLFGGRNLDDADEDKKNHIEEIGRVHSALVRAVETGVISMERLDQSVIRILRLKEKMIGIGDNIPLIPKDTKQRENCALANKIAKRAIEIKKGVLPFKLKEKKYALLISDQLKNAMQGTDFVKKGRGDRIFFFSEKQYRIEQFMPLLNRLEEFDGVFFFSNEARHPLWIDKIGEVKPLIYISVKNFSRLDNYKNARVVIITHSPSRCSFQALYDKIENGVSP